MSLLLLSPSLSLSLCLSFCLSLLLSFCLSPPCLTDGVHAFRNFLQSEFSEENIEFWVACEDFKKTLNPNKMSTKAKKIYEDFIQAEGPREVREQRSNISPPDIKNIFKKTTTYIYIYIYCFVLFCFFKIYLYIYIIITKYIIIIIIIIMTSEVILYTYICNDNSTKMEETFFNLFIFLIWAQPIHFHNLHRMSEIKARYQCLLSINMN